MSSPFTSPPGTEVCKVSLENEILSSLNERLTACGNGNQVSLAVAGGDGHLAADWQAVQNWIETICTSYVDHTAGLGAGGFAGAADIPYFTLASFRAAAGLHPDGFRRATAFDLATNDWTNPADPMFAHGQIQAGDIKGPWINQDLHAALSALKYTRAAPSGSFFYRTAQDFTGPHAVCDDAVSALLAAWAASSWQAGSAAYKYAAYASLLQSGGWWSTSNPAGRRKALLSATVPVICPCAIDAYWLMALGSSPAMYAFKDIDGLGAVQDRYLYQESWPLLDPPIAARGGAAEATWFGAVDECPFETAEIACPVPAAYSIVGYPALVVRWDFPFSD